MGWPYPAGAPVQLLYALVGRLACVNKPLRCAAAVRMILLNTLKFTTSGMTLPPLPVSISFLLIG